MCEIKNTVKFCFPNGSEKPNLDEIVNFAKSLDADLAQMDAVYRIAEDKSLFIKLKTEEAMLHVLTFNPGNLSFHYANGKVAQISMSHAGEYVQYVRIFDLPPEVPDQELALVLGKYGKVKRVIREKFPAELDFDMYTGVRGVYIDVKKEIPTSLHFLNRKGNIFYKGNSNICFVCKLEGHRMNSCPKRKDRKQKEKQQHDETQEEEKHDSAADSCSSTYANVVSGSATTEVVEVFDEEVMAIDEIPAGENLNENSKEEQASGVQEQQRRWSLKTDPIYLAAKETLRLKQLRDQKQAEERGKLRPREKGGRKLSPPAKK